MARDPAMIGGCSRPRLSGSVRSRLFFIALSGVLVSTLAAGARAEVLQWFVTDDETASNQWGHDPIADWERMGLEALEPGSCSWTDLPPPDAGRPYYAWSDPMTADYSGHHFGIKLHLASGGPNDIRVELRRGQAGDEGELLAATGRRVEGGSPRGALVVLFDLGIVADAVLHNQSLIIKILRSGEGGEWNCSIFWGGASCPTALLAEPGPPPGGFVPAQKLLGVIDGGAVWGDHDGDGDLDLVYCGEAEGTDELITRVHRNQDGSLVHQQNLEGVKNASHDQLAWGDVDRDGDLDLVVAGMSAGGPATRLYANDSSGKLSRVPATLIDVADASVAWGDVDLDGDLDLYVQGHDGGARRGVLYENDPGAPLIRSADLVGLDQGSADWADWDGDTDLDLLVTGFDGARARTVFYRNDPRGVLTADGDRGLPGLSRSDAAWGDYDNDRDLDLFITGRRDDGRGFGRLYRNDGAGNLEEAAVVGDVLDGSCAWGDYDNDGDLDLMLAGREGGATATRIFRNDAGEFVASVDVTGADRGAVTWVDVDRSRSLDVFCIGADGTSRHAALWRREGGMLNRPPSNPPGIGCGWDPGGLLLDWGQGADAETPVGGLYYCLRVSRLTGTGNDVCSGTHSTPLMGNVGQASRIVIDTPPGTYAVSIKTIDSGLLESPWSGWIVFILSPPGPDSEGETPVGAD